MPNFVADASAILCSWYLTTQEFAMNAFYEHHQDSIRFGYRCFDRILLNGLIQPFQHPERVVGFFSTYRNQYPVSREVLREILAADARPPARGQTPAISVRSS
jgi:hypothetical protein